MTFKGTKKDIKMVKGSLVFSTIILVCLNASAYAQQTWIAKDNPRQTIFLKNSKWFDGEKADGLGVKIDDQHAGRSERVRWGSVGKEDVTGYVNIQKGKSFRWYSTLDEFRNSYFKKVTNAERKSDKIGIQTGQGRVEYLKVSTFYKGLSRECFFFINLGSTKMKRFSAATFAQ